jgi:hypothetical protein
LKVHPPANSREEVLEHALRGLCDLLTKLQRRAEEYLAERDPAEFIDDTLELLDGPEQRRVQRAARVLLNEPHDQITLRKRERSK